MEVKSVRYYLFLRDVLLLAVSTFGGPQAHIAHFQKVLVRKHHYLSEEDLMEINSLCQILPGPTSTQTLTAIGYKLGGQKLAYLTLLVWVLPAVSIMTLAAILISNIEQKNLSLEFTRFIQPMAVGFVSYGAYSISLKTIHTKSGIAIMIGAGVLSYAVQSPYIFPVILLGAGLITALKYKAQPREEKKKFRVPWRNFLLWIGILILAAVLGLFTKALPIRLFENFYRSGSLVFGGGAVLTPLLYTEFVDAEYEDASERVTKASELKTKLKKFSPKPYHHPISHNEFLSGYAVAQALPGPVFSFAAYIGALSARDYGVAGTLIGAVTSSLGVFLPGTLLIFFIIRFWENLKKYRGVRASLEGITAASSGLVATSAIILFQPLENTFMNFFVVIGTFALLAFTKLPSPLIIVGGLIIGLVIK